MRLPKASSFGWLGYVVIYIAAFALILGGTTALTHYLGKVLKPTVLHHEQEAAHCYTAGKMFFVSIACVPKS
jgi:hypothetical protein